MNRKSPSVFVATQCTNSTPFPVSIKGTSQFTQTSVTLSAMMSALLAERDSLTFNSPSPENSRQVTARSANADWQTYCLITENWQRVAGDGNAKLWIVLQSIFWHFIFSAVIMLKLLHKRKHRSHRNHMLYFFFSIVIAPGSVLYTSNNITRVKVKCFTQKPVFYPQTESTWWCKCA